MVYHEYDADGWLIGWHEDADRPRSTTADPSPIPADCAIWANGAWAHDRSRRDARTLANARGSGVDAVQAHLDATSQAWGYDDIFTAVTYADEPEDPQFQAEGRALRKWRSKVWRACYASTATTVDGLLADLPPVPANP